MTARRCTRSPPPLEELLITEADVVRGCCAELPRGHRREIVRSAYTQAARSGTGTARKHAMREACWRLVRGKVDRACYPALANLLEAVYHRVEGRRRAGRPLCRESDWGAAAVCWEALRAGRRVAPEHEEY